MKRDSNESKRWKWLLGLGFLWFLSLVAVFQWSKSRATRDRVKSVCDLAPPNAVVAPSPREPLPNEAATSHRSSLDPRIPDFRRVPRSVAYGFGPIQFTEAVGEELIYAQKLSATDHVLGYRMLDELTRSLDEEGVLAAMEYLQTHPFERGENEPTSALGHLSFRLGYLLGPEIVEKQDDPSVDWDNALLGWTYEQPASALEFAFAEDSKIDFYMRRTMLMWGAANDPVQTLTWMLDAAPELAQSVGSWALGEFFQKQGSLAELDPLIGRLTSAAWATEIVSAYYLEAARGDPETYFTMVDAVEDETARKRLETDGIYDLVAERPLQTIPLMMTRVSGGEDMMEVTNRLSQLPPRDQLAILEEISDPGKRAALGLHQVLWPDGSGLDSTALSALSPAMDALLPAEWRVATKALIFEAKLSSEPESAIQQLRDDFRDFPSTATAIHEGAAEWEVRMIFEKEQSRIREAAIQSVNYDLLMDQLMGGGE